MINQYSNYCGFWSGAMTAVSLAGDLYQSPDIMIVIDGVQTI